MYQYSQVLKIVRPKRENLAESEKELQIVTEKLESARALLKEVNQRVELLENQYNAAMNKKLQLEHDSHMCVVKVQRVRRCNWSTTRICAWSRCRG
jgi:dynein heavy chain, axonemal